MRGKANRGPAPPQPGPVQSGPAGASLSSVSLTNVLGEFHPDVDEEEEDLRVEARTADRQTDGSLGDESQRVALPPDVTDNGTEAAWRDGSGYFAAGAAAGCQVSRIATPSCHVATNRRAAFATAANKFTHIVIAPGIFQTGVTSIRW